VFNVSIDHGLNYIKLVYCPSYDGVLFKKKELLSAKKTLPVDAPSRFRYNRPDEKQKPMVIVLQDVDVSVTIFIGLLTWLLFKVI